VTESHRMSRLMQQTSMAARIGGWEYDFITGKLFWTEETYRLHDLSPDTYEPIGDSALQFYVPESRALFQKTVERAMDDGKPWSLELEMITAQGRMIWVHVLGRIDFDHGKPVRTYGSFQDITERKAAELERRALDNQLLEMQRVESIGILAGGIAHDFNNLLTGVLGFTRLAAAEAEASGSETIRSHLQQIEECSLRAADLCKQLLAYAGKGQFALETIDVSELVRDTSSLVESIVGSNARLEFDLTDHLPLVEGDPTQLRQVVMNLVTNAFDALGQQDGVVRVRTGQQQFSQATLQTARARGDLPPGNHVFLEVSDTGPGMSEEVVARIFDPFFTTKFAGRGLGLAAVQGIVRTHRGAILVTSVVGKGTTFTVVLPAADDPEAQPPTIAHAAEAVVDTRAASGGTVILIDDEAAVLSLARTALERGGFKVLTAKDGPSGLEMFAAQRQEVVCVIVDMTMPGMNGLEVLRALRAADDRIPLLSMSGYTEKSLDAATAELNLAGFVEKPFRLGDLVAAVQSALAR
jgi:two-component system cell cycle sensor histidine kinase/response regulator CckA